MLFLVLNPPAHLLKQCFFHPVHELSGSRYVINIITFYHVEGLNLKIMFRRGN